MSKKAQIALYGAFTAFALFAGLVLTFPYDALGRRLEAEAAKRMPGSTLVINEIGPALPMGVRLGNVVFQGAPKDGQPGAKFEVSRVRLRPAFLKLLTGKPGVSFDVDLLSGTVAGTATGSATGSTVDATFEALQLDDGGVLEKATGLALMGGVSGRVQVTTDAKGTITDGVVDAGIAGAKIKSGKVMGFGVPPLDLGSPEVSITIEKGEGKINKLQIRSPDVEGDVTGTLSLRPDLMQSLVRGNAKVKLTDSWLNKNPTIKGMLGLAGPFKKPDGSLEVPLSGTLARPANLMGGFGRF